MKTGCRVFRRDKKEKDMLPVYLDNNATTPCDPRVVEKMIPFFYTRYGNPGSRDHSYGWVAEEAVAGAREALAKLIGGPATRMVFTSGATESVNLALKGVMAAAGASRNHLLTAKTEHKAVLETCGYLAKNGCEVTYLEVDAAGQLSLERLEAAITPRTACIALMYANNETGVIHPVKEIGGIARRHGIRFFSDATQAVGKIAVDITGDALDLVAFSAHKIYGPKGVGALYTGEPGSQPALGAQMHGGGQEGGLRSGTLNVPGIVGFGAAAALCRQEMPAESQRLAGLRDELETRLLAEIPGATVHGGNPRLPHVSNLCLPGIDAEKLLLSLSESVALSRGSACNSSVERPSHVLAAMGVPAEAARASIRVSLGRFLRAEELSFAIESIVTGVREMQKTFQPAGVAGPYIGV